MSKPAAKLHRWLPLIVGLAVFLPGPATGQPAELERHSAVYDPLRQRMVVFGGVPGPGSTTNDTWQLTLSGDPAWSRVPAGGTLPSARFGHSAVYDSKRDRMVVFGGITGAGAVQGDVWALSLSSPADWSQLQPLGVGPPARFYHTAIYDSLRDRVIVYGGSINPFIQLPSDVWSLWLSPSPRWEDISPTGIGPEGREGHSAVYDPIRDRMLVFGGYSSGVRLNDVWALSLGGNVAWARLSPHGNPPLPRLGHVCIYDPVSDQVIMSAGQFDNQQLNDVWTLSLTGAAAPSWTQLDPGAPPSPRQNLSAVYDSDRRRMVLFGGFPNVTDTTSTWAIPLEPGGQWSPFRPVLGVSPSVLRPATVTVGDTVTVPFTLLSAGLMPLRVDSLRFGSFGGADLRVDDMAAPFELGWREARTGRLTLIPRGSVSVSDSLVIVSDDPHVPRMHVGVNLEVRGLDFDARVLGEPAEVPLGASFLVTVTPRPDVRLEHAWLYYRVAGSATGFDSLAFTPLATDFVATVPAIAVTERGVDYYVRVANSGFSATEPRAPGAYFTQRVTPATAISAHPRPAVAGAGFPDGEAVEVEVTLQPGADFVSGEIHYRRGGEQDYAAGPLVPDELGRPVGTIPDSMVSARGVEYWVEVTTRAATLKFPAVAPGDTSLRTSVSRLTEPLEHPAGRYRLLSVPLDFGNAPESLDALLLNEFGQYDDIRRWRAFRYDAALEANLELSAASTAQFRPIPGRGFWLISKQPHRVDTFPLAGLSTLTSRECPIALAQGWNQIGDPFDFPVAWSDVRRDANLVTPPRAFDPSLGRSGNYAPDSVSVLMPFEGYFVHAVQPETLWVSPRASAGAVAEVHAPASGAASAATPETGGSAGAGWRFHLRASTEQAEDEPGVFGVSAGANTGFDPLDRLKPPTPPGPSVQAAFAHSDWQERSGEYSSDLRSPTSPGETWEVEVRSSTPGEIVTFEVVRASPATPDVALRLLDREQGSLASESAAAAAGPEDAGPVRSSASGPLRYRLVSFGARAYRLAVVAGTKEYVEEASRSSLSVPSLVSLDPIAPNPFRLATRVRFGLPRAEQVRLEVFDMSGRRVTALLDGETLAAGQHTLSWDGTAAAGGRAPSGLYLLRLAAGGYQRTVRLILLR